MPQNVSLGENQLWGFQIYIDVVLMVVRGRPFWVGNTQELSLRLLHLP